MVPNRREFKYQIVVYLFFFRETGSTVTGAASNLECRSPSSRVLESRHNGSESKGRACNKRRFIWSCVLAGLVVSAVLWAESVTLARNPGPRGASGNTNESVSFLGCNFKLVYVIRLQNLSIKSIKVILDILYKTFRVDYHKILFSYTKTNQQEMANLELMIYTRVDGPSDQRQSF